MFYTIFTPISLQHRIHVKNIFNILPLLCPLLFHFDPRRPQSKHSQPDFFKSPEYFCVIASTVSKSLWSIFKKKKPLNCHKSGGHLGSRRFHFANIGTCRHDYAVIAESAAKELHPAAAAAGFPLSVCIRSILYDAAEKFLAVYQHKYFVPANPTMLGRIYEF